MCLTAYALYDKAGISDGSDQQSTEADTESACQRDAHSAQSGEKIIAKGNIVPCLTFLSVKSEKRPTTWPASSFRPVSTRRWKAVEKSISRRMMCCRPAWMGEWRVTCAWSAPGSTNRKIIVEVLER